MFNYITLNLICVAQRVSKNLKNIVEESVEAKINSFNRFNRFEC